MRNYKKFVESKIDYDDLWIEFEYYNQYLSKKLKREKFEQLVDKSKPISISYEDIPGIYQRYDTDFKKLIIIKNKSSNKTALIRWWLPYYLKMKNFELFKKSEEYYYKLVDAIKNGTVDQPIFILSINDDNGKNYKFICGGRNRAALSYIVEKPIDAIIIKIPDEKIENIQRIIDDLND